MFRIKALDGLDNISWLNASKYWGPRSDSAVFSRKEANQIRDEQLKRNLYLDPVDRITITLEAQ